MADRTITLWIAFTAGFVHTICGILLLLEPSVLQATPLETIAGFVRPLSRETGIAETTMAGGFLLFVGPTALLAAFWGSTLTRLILIIPQQFALILQLVSINAAVLSGTYPDGYVPAGGWMFILADQLWAWSASLAHTFEAIRLCWTAWRSGWNGRQ